MSFRPWLAASATTLAANWFASVGRFRFGFIIGPACHQPPADSRKNLPNFKVAHYRSTLTGKEAPSRDDGFALAPSAKEAESSALNRPLRLPAWPFHPSKPPFHPRILDS